MIIIGRIKGGLLTLKDFLVYGNQNFVKGRKYEEMKIQLMPVNVNF